MEKTLRSGILTIATILSAFTIQAQESSSIANNFGRAQTILNDVYAELNYNHDISEIKLQLSGSYKRFGHYSKPYLTKEYQMNSNITVNYNEASLSRVDSFSRLNSKAITSTYQIEDDSINVTIANNKRPSNILEREKYIYQSAITCPNIFLRYVLKNAANNTFVNSDEKYHIIRHNNNSGGVYFLYIDANTYYLKRIEQPMYDAIEGDYFVSTVFEDYDLQDGYKIPLKAKIYKDSTLQYNLKISIDEIVPDEHSTNIPLSKKQIGEWLHLIPLPKWNTKAVVADLKEELVVFEPPHSPEAGYTLLENIKKAWPNKEIKYCVISHHHPDHMGGVRPFIEAGVTIVTTKGNKQYIDALSKNKHLFDDQVRKRKRVTPKYIFVDGFKHELKVADRVVVVYPMGRASSHTDEYLVSYVPNDKILIEGDLLTTWNMSQSGNSKRKRGLLKFVETNKLKVNKIVQTWPLKNTSHTIEYKLVDPDANKGLLKGSKKLMNAITK